MFTYTEGGELEPEDEETLEGKVPGEIVENDAEGEAFQEVEETKDDPISKPLDVILVAGRLYCFNGKESGKDPTDEVGGWLSECIDGVEDEKEDDAAEESVGLWNLSTLFELDEDGVFGELGEKKKRKKSRVMTVSKQTGVRERKVRDKGVKAEIRTSLSS